MAYYKEDAMEKSNEEQKIVRSEQGPSETLTDEQLSMVIGGALPLAGALSGAASGAGGTKMGNMPVQVLMSSYGEAVPTLS
jgi:lactobin A/cerein 7B family class IIb bacteriocin